MKLFKKIYHFLGSIHFAITLIGTVAIFVIAGTFIESSSGSHNYASNFTYRNPIFYLLLVCFFINILFSALRRWPFKTKHIPFLITHLGLLMILSGTFVKNYFGIQGSLAISEGSGKQEIFLPDTYVVRLEKRDITGDNKIISQDYELKKDFFGNYKLYSPQDNPFNDIDIQLVGYSPHSSEKLEGWFKGNRLDISGRHSFEINTDNASFEPIGKGFFPKSEQNWNIFAFKYPITKEIVKNIYINFAQITLKDTKDDSIIFQGSIKPLLEDIFKWKGASYTTTILLNDKNLEEACLEIVESTQGQFYTEKMAIPLYGLDAGKNTNVTSSYLGSFPLKADILQTPSLIFLENEEENIDLISFDKFGRVSLETFPMDSLKSLIVYDDAFGGYAIQANIPFMKDNRETAENYNIERFKNLLKQNIKVNQNLTPPLDLLARNSNSHTFDYVADLFEFLIHWDKYRGWIFPKNHTLPQNLKKKFKNFKWDGISDRKINACFWICKFFNELESKLLSHENPVVVLKTAGWPIGENFTFPLSWTPVEREQLLIHITKQIFEVAEHLPTPSFTINHEQLFSAFLRLHSFHLNDIKSALSQNLPENDLSQKFELESSVIPFFKKEKPSTKLENNVPLITLQISQRKKKEIIHLAYDLYGSKLKWPILNGSYKIRFQPKFHPLPYRVRLRDARQVNYSNSDQPYSFESDLLITDLRNQSFVEKTISMNNVHETNDGYRFYLSNISPSNENAVQRVQIVVNHDPGKYLLTYPGAIILTIGILLLFFVRKLK